MYCYICNCRYIASTPTTQKTQPLYCCRGVFTTLLLSNGHRADHIENTSVSIVIVLLCASRFRGNVFTEPLLRNGSDTSWFISRSLPTNGSISHNTSIKH
jgi:hypothetical protein